MTQTTKDKDKDKPDIDPDAEIDASGQSAAQSPTPPPGVDAETGEMDDSIFDKEGNVREDVEPEWETFEGGKQFEFEVEGDFVQGVLRGKSTIELENDSGEKNIIGKYTIDVQKGTGLHTGDVVTFLGSYQLDGAFKDVKPNTIIRVEYHGQRETRDRNRFRMYSVKTAGQYKTPHREPAKEPAK